MINDLTITEYSNIPGVATKIIEGRLVKYKQLSIQTEGKQITHTVEAVSDRMFTLDYGDTIQGKAKAYEQLIGLLSE